MKKKRQLLRGAGFLREKILLFIVGLQAFLHIADSGYAANTEGTHVTGNKTFLAEASFAAERYLLCRKGTADDEILVGTNTNQPFGVVTDAPAVGDYTNVALLGCANGTLLMVAAGAIVVGAEVFTDASGRISSTGTTGEFKVGRAVTAAAAAGDTLEVQHCYPVVVS